MDFVAVVDQVIALLRQRGRVAYRTLQRQFQLDAAALDDLTVELIKGQRLAADEDGAVLVWLGDAATAPAPAVAPASTPAPLTYTPPYLAEKILTAKSAMEGERKQVTVLFADLTGNTALIRDLDPETGQGLLDVALHLMMDSVHRFEGTVNDVAGDGLMAMFGAPIAHEDHALRACYAALAMQAALRRYAEEVRRTQGLEVRLRVGLHSGEVLVRTISNDLYMNYSGVGLTTNLAARMEQGALPGTIRVTAATLRLVEGAVRVHAIGPIPVKGLAEPMDVFELVGATPVHRRLQAAVARGLTRLVGREPELTMLTQALVQAAQGQGQVVSLLGEAGAGKSRLVYECARSPATQGWRVLESAAVSYGRATPYFPVLDLLKRYADVEDTDDAHTIRAKVESQILRLDARLQDTLPALLCLLDVLPDDSSFRQLDPAQRRQHLLTALTRVLLRESEEQPLLLVCEDLHWSDTETQALLDSLVERLPTACLLLLVTYRPEYQHSWGSKPSYTQLRLDPLPARRADELLQALLGDTASLAQLTPLLMARTAGNPFFLEESVRTLVETGVLVGEPGAYRLARPLDGLQVPATVQAVLAARIDRLPPEAKRLLQTAAVIGTEVPLPLLQAIAALPADTLHGVLAHLQTAALLDETRLFPARAYTFKHALTQEVAYSSLRQAQRRGLHARIVGAMETQTGDQASEQAERLAHHALHGEVWDKALRYSRKAGEKAMGQSAYRESAVYFEQALGALGHLPETSATREQAIDLRFALRTALLPSGDFARILAVLREAEALATRLDDPQRLAQVSGFLSRHFSFMGVHEQAIAVAQRLLVLATARGDGVLRTLAHFYLGIGYWDLGDYWRAIDCFRRTIMALDGTQRHERFGLIFLPAVDSRATLAHCHAELGMFAEGRAFGEEGLQIAEAAAHPASLMWAYYGLGWLSLRQGDLPRAVLLLERAVGICHKVGLSAWILWMAALLGTAYMLAGRVVDAIPLLMQAMEQTGETAMAIDQTRCRLCLGEAQLLAGRLEEAQTLADWALAYTREHQEQGHEAYALHLLGAIAARREPPEIVSAETHYRQALTLAKALSMRPLQAHCHRGLGMLYAATGQRELAQAELATAMEMYRAMDMTFWLFQTEAALTQLPVFRAMKEDIQWS